MRLFLLLPWILLLSDAERLSTYLLVGSADVFKLKCESLPYRSFIDGDKCYFAIQSKLPYSAIEPTCRNILTGASFFTARAERRDRILRLLHLDPTTFHSTLTNGQDLNALCYYGADYSCNRGELLLPGKCLIRSEDPMTWTEAENHCSKRESTALVVHNNFENLIVTGLLQKTEAGWLLPSHGDTWTAEDQSIDYWKWFFDSQTPANLKCGDPQQHAVIAGNAKSSCSAYGEWKVDQATNKNIALCVQTAQCPYCPPPIKKSEEVTTVTLPLITTTTTPTTTTKPTTTTTRPCYTNGSPKTHDLQHLYYYYNYGRRLHAFAVPHSAGYHHIHANGLGGYWHHQHGSLGGTITDAGYARIRTYCSDPNEIGYIRQMWFSRSGNTYYHTFSPGQVYVGYVSTKAGACGAKWPVRRWGCICPDVMYAGNLEGNTWYRGRGGPVVFYLWEMIESTRNSESKTGCRYG